MQIQNGETERTVYKILDRLRRGIWSVEVCVCDNSASVRLKLSRCQKLAGTRDRRVVFDGLDRGAISVQTSFSRIRSDASAHLEDRPTAAR